MGWGYDKNQHKHCAITQKPTDFETFDWDTKIWIIILFKSIKYHTKILKKLCNIHFENKVVTLQDQIVIFWEWSGDITRSNSNILRMKSKLQWPNIAMFNSEKNKRKCFGHDIV